MSKAKAQAAVDSLFNSITSSLKKEKSVSVVGFGTFDVATRNSLSTPGVDM